jgi:hypothetical protein
MSALSFNPFSTDLLSSFQFSIGERQDDSATPESASSAYEEILCFKLGTAASCLAVAADALAYDQESSVILLSQQSRARLDLAKGPVACISLTPSYTSIAYASGLLVVADLRQTPNKVWEFNSFNVSKTKWHPAKPLLGGSGDFTMVFKDFESLAETSRSFEGEVVDFEFSTEAAIVLTKSQSVTVLSLSAFAVLHEFTAAGLSLTSITSIGLYSDAVLLLVDAQQTKVSLYDLPSRTVIQRSVLNQTLAQPVFCIESRQVVFSSPSEMLVVELSADLSSFTKHDTYRFKHTSRLLTASPSSPFKVYSLGQDAVFCIQLKGEIYTTPCIKQEVEAEETKAQTEGSHDEVKPQEIKKGRKRKKMPLNHSSSPKSLPEIEPTALKEAEAIILKLAEKTLRSELKAFESKFEAIQTSALSCLDKLSSTVQAANQSAKAKPTERDIRGIIRQVVIEAVSEQFLRVIVPKFEERLQSFFGNLTLQFEASLKEQAERTAIEESKLQSINSHLVSVIETEKALEKSLSKGVAKHLGRLSELEAQLAEAFRPSANLPAISLANLPELLQVNPLKTQLDELLTKGRYEEAIRVGIDKRDSQVLIQVLRVMDPQALASQVLLSEDCRALLLAWLLESLAEEGVIEDYYSWVLLCCSGPFNDKKQTLKSFESLTVLAMKHPRLSEAKGRLLSSLVT